MNRQKIADIIDRQSHTDRIGTAYDWFMVLAILVSLLPLMFMKPHKVFWYTELGSALVFIIDYLLRWGTADIRHNNRKTAFLTYPFSFMAIPVRAAAKADEGVEDVWNIEQDAAVSVHTSQGASGAVLRLGVGTALHLRDGAHTIQCRAARESVYRSADFPFLFRCPVLGNRDAHYGRLWRHVSRYRHGPLRKHALFVVWHRRNRAAFGRDNRLLS